MRNTPPKRRGPADIEAMIVIKRCGFVCVETNGNAWVPVNYSISRARVQRLIELGLLKPKGDGLFPDSPSQTYIPVEENHVQTNQ